MSKDEALKMAIDLLESMKTGAENFMESNIHVVCSACEEALEKEWQGLTDDEIATIDQGVDEQLLEDDFSIRDYIHEFAGAIEQALKEKNSAGND